jgi:DNA-directed RNA polymerase III subunit RPC8
MFVLAEMKDTIRLPPTKFGVNLQEAITNELNTKLANKV